MYYGYSRFGASGVISVIQKSWQGFFGCFDVSPYVGWIKKIKVGQIEAKAGYSACSLRLIHPADLTGEDSLECISLGDVVNMLGRRFLRMNPSVCETIEENYKEDT